MDFFTTKEPVKFIPKESLEQEALFLLEQYCLSESGEGWSMESPPVPYEDIIERYLDLTLDFPDLREQLGYPDVLGAMYAAEHRIAIDKSLVDDPRFPFTCAHEIGHWVLHRHLFEIDPNQLLLFDVSGPSIVCRDGHKKDRIELQANKFAASLLMPRGVFSDCFENLRERCGLCPDRSGWNIYDEGEYSWVVAELASLFGSSKESTRIRIKDLYLVNMCPALF